MTNAKQSYHYDDYLSVAIFYPDLSIFEKQI